MLHLVKMQQFALAIIMFVAPSAQAMQSQNTTDTVEQAHPPETKPPISDHVSNILASTGTLLLVDFVLGDSKVMATILKYVIAVCSSPAIVADIISFDTIWAVVDNQLSRICLFEVLVGPGLISAPIILNAKYQIDENAGWDIWYTYIGASARLFISGLFFMGAGTLLQRFGLESSYFSVGQRTRKTGLIFTAFAYLPISWHAAKQEMAG